MYVCVCVRVCVRVHIYTQHTHYTYMQCCTHTRMQTHIHTTLTYMDARTHARIHTYTHYTYIHGCTHTRAYTHTRTRTHVHTHGVYNWKQYIRICLCTSQTPPKSRGPSNHVYFSSNQFSHTKLGSQIINTTIHLSKTSFSVIVSLSTL